MKIALETLMLNYSFKESENVPLTFEVASDIFNFTDNNNIHNIVYNGSLKTSETIIMSMLQQHIDSEQDLFSIIPYPKYSLVESSYTEKDYYEMLEWGEPNCTMIDHKLYDIQRFGIDILRPTFMNKIFIWGGGGEGFWDDVLYTINFDTLDNEASFLKDIIEMNLLNCVKSIIIFDYEDKLFEHKTYQYLIKNNFSCTVKQYFLKDGTLNLKNAQGEDIKICNIFYCVNTNYTSWRSI